MNQVKTASEFEHCLRFERAIIFIFFQWSGHAHQSKSNVLDFENEWTSQYANLNVEFWEIQPDENKVVCDWVQKEVKDLFGYGSLVWLSKGEILAFEKCAALMTVEELEEKSKSLFTRSLKNTKIEI